MLHDVTFQETAIFNVPAVRNKISYERKVFWRKAPYLMDWNKKVKISLLQAVEAHRVARGQGSHIT
jgi:hypothetical protein